MPEIPSPAPPSSDRSRLRRRGFAALGGLVSVAALGAVAYWQLYASRYASTENAYTAAEIAQVTPAIDGTIREVRVVDTQPVASGEVLALIDDRDARLALQQAEAELDRSRRRLLGYRATDGNLAALVKVRQAEESQATAQLASAAAELRRARVDLERRTPLAPSGAVSGDELTRIQHAFDAASAGFDATQAALLRARANRAAGELARAANAALIDGTPLADHPEIVFARSRRDQARLDLERTVIRAPVAGIVAKRQVEVGQRVKAGAALLSVVPVGSLHVDANFKEVQLDKVRIGQPVTIHADLYGSDVSYHGRVAGLAGGTGAAFALIPAQNATGNWIKVVQRLPVRIHLDPAELLTHPLGVGLSVAVRIDTGSGG